MTDFTEIRLGSEQRGMLDAMRRHLTFRRGSNWMWRGGKADSKLLKSLAKHGFVDIVFEDERGVVEAEVTRTGIAWLQANPRRS